MKNFRSLRFRSILRAIRVWVVVSAVNLLFVVAGVFLYAFVWETHHVVVERVRITRPSRTGHEGSVRIAQISDLDLTSTPGYVERRAAKLIAQAKPDFIVFTGDVIGNVSKPRGLELLTQGVEWLGSLDSAHGTFFVLGEEERGFRREIESSLPPRVRLVEDSLETLAIGGLRVQVCGPGGHFPEVHPVSNRLGPVLLAGEGASRASRFFAGAGSTRWSDYELTGRLRLERPGDAFGIVIYAADGNRGYEFAKRQGESGFRPRALGDLAKLSGERKGITAIPQTGIWHRFRIRAETTQDATWIWTKFWQEATPEPEDWQGELSDTTVARSRGGTIGVVTGGWECGREKYVDDIAVRPIAGGEALLVEGFEDPDRFAREWPGPDIDYSKSDLVVMAAHSPNVLDGMHYERGIDLMLLGHTHGGQAVLPLFGPVESKLIVDPALYTGTHELGPLVVHINRGLGTAIVPARVNCPPEVTVIDWTIESRGSTRVP